MCQVFLWMGRWLVGRADGWIEVSVCLDVGVRNPTVSVPHTDWRNCLRKWSSSARGAEKWKRYFACTDSYDIRKLT